MYDVIKHYPRVDKELIELYTRLGESASIHECMNKTGAMDSRMRPLWPGNRLCGVALTVQCRPADNIMLHKAIDMAQRGDVIVVCCGEYIEAGGMWGGMMTASAMTKGVAGLVTDSSVRDSILIKKLGFPVFSCGINIKGSTKALPGTINHTVCVCGVTVNPGDLIFGDNDAVVVVPREKAQEIYHLALSREQKEDVLLKRIQNGAGTTFDLLGFNKNYEKLGLSEEP
jgi:4-hydroxy-4-methyl-2-oxoglutarate aldolase